LKSESFELRWVIFVRQIKGCICSIMSELISSYSCPQGIRGDTWKSVIQNKESLLFSLACLLCEYYSICLPHQLYFTNFCIFQFTMIGSCGLGNQENLTIKNLKAFKSIFHEGFFFGFSGFPPSVKINILNSNSIGNWSRAMELSVFRSTTVKCHPHKIKPFYFISFIYLFKL
jgi:hypothetical protein